MSIAVNTYHNAISNRQIFMAKIFMANIFTDLPIKCFHCMPLATIRRNCKCVLSELFMYCNCEFQEDIEGN